MINLVGGGSWLSWMGIALKGDRRDGWVLVQLKYVGSGGGMIEPG